jgi:hypothetical protein
VDIQEGMFNPFEEIFNAPVRPAAGLIDEKVMNLSVE